MSTKQTIIAIVVVLLLIGAALLGGYIWGRNTAYSSIKTEAVRTITVHDTIRQNLPIPVKEYVYKDRIVEVPAWDTVHIYHTDTLYIGVPYQVKEYRDSNYFAKVGGYEPELLEIETYNRTITQTVTLPDKKWGLGIQGGLGVGYNKGLVAVPYIGIGVSYNILQW